MLEYDEFREKMLKAFEKRVTEELPEYRLFNEKTRRTNTVMENIGVRPKTLTEKSPISPVMYIENLYENYLKGDREDSDFINDTVVRYFEAFETGKKLMESMCTNIEDFFDKETVVAQVINAEKNKEYLSDKPHRLFLDLAVIYRFDAPLFNGSIVVNNGIAKEIKMTEKELYNAALKNMERQYAPQVRRLTEMLRNDYNKELDDDLDGASDILYVVTNEEKLYGANALLMPSSFEKLAEKTGGDFYVIPSSVHELLAVSDVSQKAEDLQEMLLQVNATPYVSETEWLSDNLYKYNAVTKQIEYAFPEDVKKKEKDSKAVEEKKPEKDAKVI